VPHLRRCAFFAGELLRESIEGLKEDEAVWPPDARDAKVAKRGLDPLSVETVPNIDFLDRTGVPRAEAGLPPAGLLLLPGKEVWVA